MMNVFTQGSEENESGSSSVDVTPAVTPAVTPTDPPAADPLRGESPASSHDQPGWVLALFLGCDVLMANFQI